MMNSKQQRLAIFIPSMRLGGAERSMLKLAQGMIARNYSVDLVLAQKEGPYLDEVPDGVRLIDLRSSRIISSLPALIRYLRKEKPMTLLSVMNYANIIALWARSIAGVDTRIVVSERNTLSQESKNSASWRGRVMPFFVKQFYPRANGIVAVSHGVAEDLQSILKNFKLPITVIYNPIITPEFKKKVEESLDHPWFKKNQPPVILALGRLKPQKDYPTLIQAFSALRKNKKARLLILGEGSERAKLEKMIEQLGLKEDISLPGLIKNPYPYLRRASLFVLSSRWEGLPGVLIEALYCGSPIIATDCPSGPQEILQNGKYGQLVPVGDVNSLAQEMEKSLNGKKYSGNNDSCQPFDQEVVVQQYIDLLFEKTQ